MVRGCILSPKTSVHSLTPSACDLIRNKVFAGAMKLRGEHRGLGWALLQRLVRTETQQVYSKGTPRNSGGHLKLQGEEGSSPGNFRGCIALPTP